MIHRVLRGKTVHSVEHDFSYRLTTYNSSAVCLPHKLTVRKCLGIKLSKKLKKIIIYTTIKHFKNFIG